MKFSNHESDLQILTENEVEVTRLRNFCYVNKLVLESHYSNVEGQDWYGKRYFEIPFGVTWQDEIFKFCTEG